MSNASVFLISTLFDLYLMVVILRLWLQLVRADFYNPASQFIVKATHPIVGPLRRIIPSVGNFDTATFVLALLVAALKFVTLVMLFGSGMHQSGIYYPAGVFNRSERNPLADVLDPDYPRDPQLGIAGTKSY